MITDRIGLHSVLLPLLRPFDNAQKGACKLFGILSRTQYMPKKVYHMAYYPSSLCSSDFMLSSDSRQHGKFHICNSDAKKGTLSSH